MAETELKQGVDVTTQFLSLPGDSLEAKIEAAVDQNKVVVFGRSTCPFCIEVTRTLIEMGVKFTYYRIDLFNGQVTGPQVHDVLKSMTGQRTVPYVYVNRSLVGGCDATKAMISTGEFDKLLGKGNTNGAEPEEVDLEAAKDQSIHPKLVGVDDDAPTIVGSLLEFPNTVDGRVIRLVATQVFIISLLIAALAYKDDLSWRWVSVGLLTDFCLRFYAGAGISPLGSVAMFILAVWDNIGPTWFKRTTGPVWGAGPPKQFAVAVGIFFSAMIVVFQFTRIELAVIIFAGVLAFFAALEAFVNFCAGCWVFGHAIRLGIIPDTVYMVHINTLPETKYTWDDWTKTVNPPKPQPYTEHFKGHEKTTRVDLFYKTGKNADTEREDFAYVRNSKIAFFSSVIGVAAVPAMFKFMSMSPRFDTPDLIWQILTLLSLLYAAFFTVPYILKAIRYPHKIRQEWQHPAMNNAFTIPSMTLIVYAFLATETYSTALARVLWWAGSSTAFFLAIVIVGNWLATMRHEAHVNGAWLMSPVGLYIAAVVGPIVDPNYREISYLFFGFASIMYITLFIMAFQRFAVGPNADPRQRVFAAIWFAAPAVSSIAWSVLTAAPGQPYIMDPIAQTLFYVAVSMALVNLWMAWRRFLWADKFFMQMWAFGFPTVALAWDSVLYDSTINTALSKVLACVVISIASICSFVLVLRTFAGVMRLKVFLPEVKMSPMSHLPLAHDSMRAILKHIVISAEALAENPGNTRLASSLKMQWRTFATINTFYSTIKKQTCFPQIGTFFPGHQDSAMENNDKMMADQARVEQLMSNKFTTADYATIKHFAQQCDATFTHVEDHVRPVVKRYIPVPVMKKIIVDCWDDADPEGWWAVIPAIVQNLPMQSQRLTFIRAFLMAMPERCQQIGMMLAIGVDPVLWYRLRHQIPDIIPRGESGWKRF